MAPSRYRLILGILSIVSLASSIYFLSKFSTTLNSGTPSYSDLIITVISSFNIAILFAWFASGLPGGLPVSFLSIAAVALFCLKAGPGIYPVFLAIFSLTSFAGYVFSRGASGTGSAYVLKLEKLDEEINVLSNDAEERRRRIGFLREKLGRYSALKNVVESFSTVLSLDDINRLIVKKASETLGKEGRVLLFLVDVDRQELMLSASGTEARIKAKKGDFFDQWVLRHRKSLLVEDVGMDFRFPVENIDESKYDFRSLIATPMVSDGKVIGILRMDSPRGSIYTQDDLRLLDIIANLGAAAVQNAILYSRTQELAIKDGLTGLFVRGYFMERFREEVKRSAGKKGTLSFLMLDIDHFKDYNDKYGHMFGDVVLKYFAKIMASVAREGDAAGRYGGEEMVMLFCGMDKERAVAEAEKIRKALREKPFVIRRKATNITVSIGLSNYPEDAVLEEELIRIADERLYKAKTAGRDRVCSE